MTTIRSALRTTTACALLGAMLAVPAQAQDNFYEGRNITLISSFAPGGLSGMTGQLVGNHLGRFIPGNPNIIVQHMQGAAGLIAANQIYNTDQQDGTVIGQIDRVVAQRALVGDENARYDILAFNWLGSLSSYEDEAYIVFVNSAHPAQSIEEINTSDEPARLGVVTGATNHIMAAIAEEVLGYDFEIIRGYEGTAAIRLAIENGEVDGTAMGLQNLMSADVEAWEAGRYRPLVQFGRETRHPDIPDVPTGRELAETEDDLALVQFSELPFTVAVPLVAPPGVPEERVEILRRAFDEMVADPEFIAEAEQIQLILSPISGERVHEILEEIDASFSDELIARYNAIFAAQ